MEVQSHDVHKNTSFICLIESQCLAVSAVYRYRLKIQKLVNSSQLRMLKDTNCSIHSFSQGYMQKDILRLMSVGNLIMA